MAVYWLPLAWALDGCCMGWLIHQRLKDSHDQDFDWFVDVVLVAKLIVHLLPCSLYRIDMNVYITLCSTLKQ